MARVSRNQDFRVFKQMPGSLRSSDSREVAVYITFIKLAREKVDRVLETEHWGRSSKLVESFSAVGETRENH